MLDTKLSTIMSTEVITVAPQDHMEKVDDIFRANNIHHLPVVDDQGKVVGIISKGDYLMLCDSMTLFRKDVQLEKNRRLFYSVLVEEVMSKQVATLNMNDTVGIAAGFFRENLFHAIPILNDQGKLAGIVTTFDMLNYAYREPARMIEQK